MSCGNLQEQQWHFLHAPAQSGFLTKFNKNRRRFLKPQRVVGQPAPLKVSRTFIKFEQISWIGSFLRCWRRDHTEILFLTLYDHLKLPRSVTLPEWKNQEDSNITKVIRWILCFPCL